MDIYQQLILEQKTQVNKLSTKWTKQLKKVSPDLQDEIIRINSDSRILKQAFDFDFIGAGELNAILGAAFIRLLADESVRYASEEQRAKIIGLHRNLTAAVHHLSNFFLGDWYACPQ